MVRQPKKLTDCPENLRESIDWLIQVKHGNGNGEDGLGPLAEALKKLITEAIKNARESLNERQKELDCHKDFKHCGELKQQIKDAKGDEKSKLQSKYNGHYSEVHGSESKRDTAKKDLKERQEKLKELSDKLKTLIGDENNNKNGECKKILENHTEGLEKFLGFNPNSKGYDGTGIVYSDLDRLCDGVMAFLHGVLSGVKDDDEVC
ncbi:hypothetical protein, conserved [Babesia ovata]|uniref:Uncharacterized protein n=1 Tax=Babesia ovata TaxID=189622 RepID=A0A2H6K7B3_9APIC|nr:uncharacterized protein BOVATA_003320 [Babesia ovata]GBE58839.1 hypothetical protein, conserved [Babesia ovata]